MKIHLLFCLSFLVATTSLFAQQDKEADSTEVVITKYGVGVKAGFNFATVTQGSLNKNPDARPSVYIGFNYELPIVENVFSIQPEIIYSRQGFEKRFTSLDDQRKSVYQLDYLTLPILARYYVVRGFSLEAGPQFSYLIANQSDRDGADPEVLNLGDAKKLDIGFAGGLTFQFESGFFVNGRYLRSFSEIADGLGAKNTVFQFGAGYKF